MADQATRHVRAVEHWRFHGRKFARTEPTHGALATVAAHAHGIFEFAPVARRAVPIVALHVLAFRAEHRAADAVHRAGIRRDETQRIAVRANAAMRTDARALGI